MSDNNSIVLLHSHKHVGQRPKNKADGSSSEVRGQRSEVRVGLWLPEEPEEPQHHSVSEHKPCGLKDILQTRFPNIILALMLAVDSNQVTV